MFLVRKRSISAIMKILVVTPTFFPDVGGVETMLMEFCRFLARRRYRAHVITYNPLIAPAKAPRHERVNDFVAVSRIPWIGRGLFNVFENYPLIQFLYLVPMLTAVTLSYVL
ncbi:MAG: hypothetical protein M1335_04385, partial [Chloroflexi bacterium]|nr:hypothetical protein [Chloroflexota bacterium]